MFAKLYRGTELQQKKSFIQGEYENWNNKCNTYM